MIDTMELEFGFNLPRPTGAAEFAAGIRRAEELGYDVFAAPDHLGALDPFVTLATVAQLSSQLRLRSYVLNQEFWNPVLLARAVASVDQLSGGRVELGIGAGHMKSEHDDAGLVWRPLAERIARMERLIVEVRERLADPGHAPAVVQHPVPVVVGAMSEAGLAVAARCADVVAFTGLRQLRGEPPGTFTFTDSAVVAERVAQVRDQAAGRSYRSDVLLQYVELGDVDAAVGRIVAENPKFDPEVLRASPFTVFAADADEAAAELVRRSRQYGFTQFSTHQFNLEALGRVIRAIRG